MPYWEESGPSATLCPAVMPSFGHRLLEQSMSFVQPESSPLAQLRARLPASLALCALVLAGPVACGPDEEDENPKRRDGGYVDEDEDNGTGGGDKIPTEFMLLGYWKDPSGDLLRVTETRWETLGSVKFVEKFDNRDQFAIVQNSPSAPVSPGQFAKHVWTNWSEDGFHLCVLSGYGSAEEAENSARRVDPEDLNGEGCGGASWTRMTRAEPDIEIRGRWRDSLGNTFTVTGTGWLRQSQAGGTTEEEVVKYDNGKRWLITRRSESEYTRLVWTEPDQDRFLYCEDYPVGGYPSADAAESAVSQLDPTNLENGCRGWAWRQLVRVH